MAEEKKKVGRPRKKDIVEEVKEEARKELKDSLKPGVQTPQLPQFINASRFRFIDITSELFREYIYPNGSKIRIEFPMKLNVAQNNSHRLFDMNGFSYYIPTGWISIIWKSRPGAPNFIM